MQISFEFVGLCEIIRLNDYSTFSDGVGTWPTFTANLDSGRGSIILKNCKFSRSGFGKASARRVASSNSDTAIGGFIQRGSLQTSNKGLGTEQYWLAVSLSLK